MSEGVCARLALAGLAGLVLLLGGCSQSPAPATRKSDAGSASPAVNAPPTATTQTTPASPAVTAAPGSPNPAAAALPSAPPHSSEAEIKSSPVAVTPAAPPLVSASNAAPAPAAADSPPPVQVRSAPAAAAPGLVTPIDAPASRRADPSVVVVDAADPDPDAKLSLVDAAKAERERKAEAPPPRIVINNKNLRAYAKGGQLTIAEPKKKGSAASPAPVPPAGAAKPTTAAAGAPGAVAPLERDEKYWRGRALEIRQRWRKAADRIKQLEGDVNLWRRRFYAEDDPYVRDGQIKPTWDRALDELRENREAVAAARKELDDFLEEGRRAGALPGWLREGSELEPKEEKPVDPLQPTETPIYKENGR